MEFEVYNEDILDRVGERESGRGRIRWRGRGRYMSEGGRTGIRVWEGEGKRKQTREKGVQGGEKGIREEGWKKGKENY